MWFWLAIRNTVNSIYNGPDLSTSVTIDYFLSELQNNASSENIFKELFFYLSHGINIGLILFTVRSRESSKLISAKEKLKIPFSFTDP